MTTTYWCERALMGDVVRDGVAIEVEADRICAVTPGVHAPASATCFRGITIPGFANAHSHAFHRALRGHTQVGRGSFWTWRDQMYQAALALTPDSYHRLARATFAEMALAGIVVVGEFHYVHHQRGGRRYEEPNAMGEALIAAAQEAGIRITLLDTLYLHGGLETGGYLEPGSPQLRFSDGSAQGWAERVDSLRESAGCKVGAAIHSVRAVDPKSATAAVEWVSARGAPIHAHVSEQPAENVQCRAAHGVTPTEMLHDCGVLDAPFTAVHGTHLSHHDIDLLGSNSCGVCFCPTTERDLADGIGPSGRLVETGVDLSLGSDSHAVIDMFEESRALELNERLATTERGTHSATELLSMATVAGHRSLGWDDAGELRAGARADLVSVALDSVRTAGADSSSAAAALVFSATAADVTDVVVDGKVVVTGGRHVSVDVAGELQAAIAEVQKP